MTDFRNKAASSLFWSFFETFGSQGVQFIIGVILARLLTPENYGLIGVLAIFIGIAAVLVDSGFKISIIRSKELSPEDCSTIFYLNLTVSFTISLVFYISSSYIAAYFSKPELGDIVKVFATLPLINGFGLVQSALLIKELKFKSHAKISILANCISGLISILLAMNAFSYWALVWKAVSMAIIYNCLIWYYGKWKPKLFFSLRVLKKHFHFGSKLLLTGIVDSFFDNIYSLIFGKYFSMKDLGFFTRGKGYADLATTSISVAIQKVNTPLLSHVNTDHENVFSTYTKLLRSSSLLVFSANALLFSIAKPLILLLLGDKWLEAIQYLQILTLSGMIYSILNSNSSFLEVMGRSDLILKNTLIGRPIQVAILILTIQADSIAIAWGIVLHYFIMLLISFYIVSLVSEKKISLLFKPLIEPMMIASLMGIAVYFTGKLLFGRIHETMIITVQLAEAFIITVGLIKLLNLNEYLLLRSLMDKFAIKLGLLKQK